MTTEQELTGKLKLVLLDKDAAKILAEEVLKRAKKKFEDDKALEEKRKLKLESLKKNLAHPLINCTAGDLDSLEYWYKND